MKLNNKIKAILVGIFILVAYGVLVSGFTSSKPLVMIADVISGLVVIGIAAIMYPFFKSFGKKRSLIYLLLKILEGTLMVAAGILFNSSLQFMRDWIYNGIHLWVFIISGFIFYCLLYKSKLVPRFISVWGTVAIFTLLIKSVLMLFNLGSSVVETMLVLIITNEIFLAIWLMVRGFKTKK